MHTGKKENTLASLALLHITSECYICLCDRGHRNILFPATHSCPRDNKHNKDFFYYLFLEILADTTFMTAIPLKGQMDIVLRS